MGKDLEISMELDLTKIGKGLQIFVVALTLIAGPDYFVAGFVEVVSLAGLLLAPCWLPTIAKE